MKVSVIVATHSHQMFEHLKECIDSLLDQSYNNLEIICIVDGNKDYFEKVKSVFNDLRIDTYLNEKNMGLLYSRNRGVEFARGDIVAFIDDDAIADSKWIEELVKIYKNGAIAVGGKIEPLWIAEKPRWFPEEFYWMIGVTNIGFPENVTEVRNTFGSNLSFRKNVFFELGGFNLEMGGIKGKKMLQGGETEFCERLRRLYGKGVVYNPNAVVYHKIFPNRLSLKFLVKRAYWQGYSKAVMERIIGEIKEEKSYLKFLLKDRLSVRFTNMLKGSVEDAAKILMILFFTFVVSVGYLKGSLSLKKHIQQI